MKHTGTIISLIFTILVSLTGKLMADPVKVPLKDARRTIDSLNELAFQAKRNDINKAVSLLLEASHLADQYDYKKGKAVNLLYEAGMYHQYGYHKKALSLYFRSREISIQSNDTLIAARANQQIGAAFSDNNNLPAAENLYKQAMDAYVQLNRTEDIINMQNALGMIKLSGKDLKETGRYFTEAEKGSIRIDYTYGLKKARYNLGLLHLEKGNLSRARTLFENSLELNVQERDHYGMSLNKTRLAEIAARQLDFEAATALALSAFNDAQSISAMRLMVDAVGKLSEIYERQNMPERVIEWQRILIDEQARISEREKSYSMEFLDLLKARQEERVQAEARVLDAQQRAKYSAVITMIVSIALAILAILAFLLKKNFRRAKVFGKYLAEKNALIEKQIKELRELNEEILHQNASLEESNQMKNKLLSILSHDLRTPLINTRGILEFINAGDLNAEESKEVFDDLENQYVKVIALLDNLLFWIKGQMQGDEVEPVQIDLKTLIDEVVKEQEVPLRNKHVTVENVLEPDLVISGHPEMIKAIFRNLLSNAIKFTDHGVIRFYSTIGDTLAIHVQDEGVGMSAETLDKVKKRTYFTTLGTQKEAGSGFGLMICKDLINKHKGELDVTSAPGKGSTFTVKLPGAVAAMPASGKKHLAAVSGG